MPQNVSDQQLAEALLQSVRHGSYPESEEVISAVFRPSAFSIALGFLEDARKEVKGELRELSWESGSDIDDWLEQAKQLHDDVERSKGTADEILQSAKEEQGLQDEIVDATSKTNLLKAEVSFNQTLAETLEFLQEIDGQIDGVQENILKEELSDAIGGLDDAEARLSSLRRFEGANAVILSRQRIQGLRETLHRILETQWDAWISVEPMESRLSIRSNAKGSAKFTDTVKALASLNVLNQKIDILYRNLENLIIRPRMAVAADKSVAAISIQGDQLTIDGRSSDMRIGKLFQDLRSVISYLDTRLPADLAVPLSKVFIPSLISFMLSTWLASSVPSSLEDMNQFQQVLALAENFLNEVDSLGWGGAGQLQDWIDDAPKVWLSKRREDTLQRVRSTLSTGMGATKVVERVETQKISRDDEILHGSAENDWDANWSDEESVKSVNEPSRKARADEEDVSAWGLDEEDNHGQDPGNAKEQHPVEGEDDDAGDAWGWDDEAHETPSAPPSPHKTKTPKRDVNGRSRPKSESREVTLKETLTLTEIPEALLELVQQVIRDHAKLSDPSSRDTPVALAAPGLTSLPTLLFAFYRAAASSHYSQHPSGNMLLYNDAVWLSDQLHQLAQPETAQSGTPRPPNIGRFKLDADVKTLGLSGKRAYAKEMESQRTILGDLLDGAQGFNNCMQEPFASACDDAISSTIDRIRTLSEQWKGILSSSALLQSLGSLLSHVTSKIVVDVEDMSDISERESQRLARLCTELSKLEDLFLPSNATGAPHDSPQAGMPLTAVYTPNWLKFQYLANILESSLVDIRFLWSEGELSLEFAPEEVIDLIEALFADSDHRRKAIAEIRRHSRNM